MALEALSHVDNIVAKSQKNVDSIWMVLVGLLMTMIIIIIIMRTMIMVQRFFSLFMVIVVQYFIFITRFVLRVARVLYVLTTRFDYFNNVFKYKDQ